MSSLLSSSGCTFLPNMENVAPVNGVVLTDVKGMAHLASTSTAAVKGKQTGRVPLQDVTRLYTSQMLKEARPARGGAAGNQQQAPHHWSLNGTAAATNKATVSQQQRTLRSMR